VGANRPACAASAGEIAEFLHRLARLRPPALGGNPAEHAALCWPSASSCTATDGESSTSAPTPPLADLVHTVAENRPDVVILAAVTPERFQESIPDLITLARTAPLRLAGAGATTSIADTVGATILAGDPITEAQRLTPLS
jgi:hypothetical protein